MKELTVKMVEHREDSDLPEDDSHITLLGGDTSNPSWEQYLEQYKDEFRPYLLSMKQWFTEKFYDSLTNDFVNVPTGSDLCNYYHWEFSDGKKMFLSWRAWGDFAQAVVNKNEGYMTYYM